MPVDGEHVRSASKAGTAKNADDSETAVTTDTKTENVQGLIQAMQKELNLLKEGLPWEDEDEEGSAEEPVEEEVVDEEVVEDAVQEVTEETVEEEQAETEEAPIEEAPEETEAEGGE